MSNRLSRINARIWRHKYLWTIILFIVYVGFIDTNSFWYRYRLKKENEATLAEIRHYEQRFENDRQKLQRLKSDPDALLQVAREDHQMKSADEDVYYIIEETDEAEAASDTVR